VYTTGFNAKELDISPREFVNFNWFSEKITIISPNAIIETNFIKHACIVFCGVRTNDLHVIQISFSLYTVKKFGDHKPN
jgi:hypothetical protein